MSDYRDPAPIFFGPPRRNVLIDAQGSKFTASVETIHCDHLGKKIYSRGQWKCAECRATLNQE